MPPAVADVLYIALRLYWLLLLARLIADYVFMFTRARASGVVAAILEFVYTLTDPPLKALRRVLPPLRLGNFSIDVGFIVLIMTVGILAGVVARYR